MFDLITSLIHLIKHVQNSHPQYLLLYNTPQVVQTSVSLIIQLSNPIQRRSFIMPSQQFNYITRIQMQQEQCMKYLHEESMLVDKHKLKHNPQYSPDISIILTKRSQNPKDKNAGQLCYPGGTLKTEENDYSAALRETKEEIGYDLAENTFSLGRLPINFNAYHMDSGKQSKIAVNVFFSPKSIKIEELTLNRNEIDKVLFLPLRGLSDCKVQIYNDLKNPLNELAQPGQDQETIKLILHDYQFLQTPFYDFENEKFYGLSWLILMNLLKVMNYQNEPNINRVVQQTKDAYKFHFKEESDLKSKFISMIYDDYRLNQFFK